MSEENDNTGFEFGGESQTDQGVSTDSGAEDTSIRGVLEETLNAEEERQQASRLDQEQNTEKQVRPPEKKGKAATGKGKQAGGEAPAVVPGQAGEAPQAQEPAREIKAPQSWKPAAREQWVGIPDTVKQEIYRREHEINRFMHETSEIRKVGEGLLKAAKPYEQFIVAEGSDPVQAAANMFNTAARLRIGTPFEKAQLITGLIQQFGIDIPTLDAVLSGQMPAQQQQQQQQRMPQMPQGAEFRDPRFDQLMGAIEQRKAQRMNEMVSTAQNEVATFGADKEFYEDVRLVMADLIEMNANRGIDLSLEDAYIQACKLDDQISQVIAQRQMAQNAQQRNQSLQRSRNASSSIHGAPGGDPALDPTKMSRRQAILSAIDNNG